MTFEVSPHLIGGVIADFPMSASGWRHPHYSPSDQFLRVAGIRTSTELLGRVEHLRADRHGRVLQAWARSPCAASSYHGATAVREINPRVPPSTEHRFDCRITSRRAPSRSRR